MHILGLYFIITIYQWLILVWRTHCVASVAGVGVDMISIKLRQAPTVMRCNNVTITAYMNTVNLPFKLR